MILKGNSVITDIWVQHAHFRETKQQFVSHRPFHSLSFRLSGRVTFDIDGKACRSTENSITFMPAGVDYVTQIEEAGDMFVIHFETADTIPDAQPLFLNNRADLKHTFADLYDHYHASGTSTYRSLSLFYALLDTLSQPRHAIPRRMRHAKYVIDTQFSQTVNIAQLAQEAGISDVHFRNEFKRCYGLSPLSYLKQVRIQNAKQLLRSGYYTVTDVALECGFENISYFSYEFKRLTGESPSSYIRRF